MGGVKSQKIIFGSSVANGNIHQKMNCKAVRLLRFGLVKLTAPSKPLLLNVNKDLLTWKTVIVDKAFKVYK